MRIGSGIGALLTGAVALATVVAVWSGAGGLGAAEGSAEAIIAEELQDHPAGEDLVLRRVVAGEDLAMEELSSDARRRAFTDYEDAGNLVLEDLKTGEARRLTEDGNYNRGGGSGGHAMGSSFAPDGRRVAVGWFDPTGPNEIRVIDVESGEEHRIFRSDDEWAGAIVHGWTPDGEALVVAPYTRGAAEYYLALLDAKTGEIRLLRGEREGSLSGVAVSPDGEWVAYFLGEEKEDQGDDSELRRLHMAPLDGGSEVATDVVAPNGSVAGWLPTGGPLFYQTGRDGIMTVVAQSMDGPEATSEPRAVKRDLVRPSFMGTVDGGLVFRQTPGSQTRVRLFELDDDAGELVQRGGPTPGAPSELHGQAQWTDGGATLLYQVVTADEGSTESVVFRSPSTGDERRVSVPMAFAQHMEVTEDGNLFVGYGWPEGGPTGSYLITMEDGVAGEPVRVRELDSGERCLGLREGGHEMICRVRAGSEEESGEDRFVAHSLDDHEERVLRTAPEGIRWTSLSPKRDEVAVERQAGEEFGEERVVEILDLRSDDRRELWSATTDEFLRGPEWSADGEAVTFVVEGSEEGPVHVVDREGGNPRTFALPDGLRPESGETAGGALHPDGSTLALGTSDGPGLRMEIWVMENLRDEAR